MTSAKWGKLLSEYAERKRLKKGLRVHFGLKLSEYANWNLTLSWRQVWWMQECLEERRQTCQLRFKLRNNQDPARLLNLLSSEPAPLPSRSISQTVRAGFDPVRVCMDIFSTHPSSISQSVGSKLTQACAHIHTLVLSWLDNLIFPPLACVTGKGHKERRSKD